MGHLNFFRRQESMSVLAPIVIIAGVSLITSFFCSLLEACLYSVSRSRIQSMVREGSRNARVLSRLRQSIEESIAAILVVNTVANTLGAAWAGALVQEWRGSTALSIFSGVFTAAVLFFAEIVPKSLGVRFADKVAPALAIPLQLMVWALWPIIKVCVLLTRMWGKNVRISHGTEEDIISLAQLIQQQGVIHPHEAHWVANALRLDDTTAYDLMTPSPVVARVPVTMALQNTQMNADHWRYSRLPVCEDEDPDQIVGVLRRRRVFNALARDEFDKTVGDLMESAEFVEGDTPAHLLLDQFLQKRRHLFCVRDKAGHFIGVVTLEDVLESLLGREIVDETDIHEDMQEVARKRKEELLTTPRQKTDTPLESP